MDLKKIQSIKFSLMKKTGDVNKKGIAEYDKRVSADFKIPEGMFEEHGEDILQELVTKVYEDIMNIAPDDVDSLGLWVTYNDVIFENAMSLQTIKDISEYSIEDVSPVYEFFKMTVNENG